LRGATKLQREFDQSEKLIS